MKTSYRGIRTQQRAKFCERRALLRAGEPARTPFFDPSPAKPGNEHRAEVYFPLAGEPSPSGISRELSIPFARCKIERFRWATGSEAQLGNLPKAVEPVY